MKTAVWAAALFFSTTVLCEQNYIVIQERCTQDNLGPEEAKLRNAWARKCFPDLQEDIDLYARKKPLKYALGHNEKTGSDKAPLDVNAPCDNWHIVAFCVAACYTGDQMVKFLDGYTPILNALKERKPYLLGLRHTASVNHIQWAGLPVESYSQSLKDAEETIRYIETRQGSSLDVTLGHPIMLADGKMVLANDIHIGDRLLNAQGAAEDVITVQDRTFFGKVYNVAPISSHPLNNIIDAQGILVGSSKYQNLEELTKLTNRKVLRKLVRLPVST